MLPDAWRYPFFEEPELRRSRVVFRPVVPITVAGLPLDRALDGLVDTGSESTLVASWVADLAGLDLTDPVDIIRIGVGGTTVEDRFLEVELRLHRWPDAPDHEYTDWRAEVGFVTPWRPLYPILLGQHGLLDQFTVTTSRTAQELTIETSPSTTTASSNPEAEPRALTSICEPTRTPKTTPACHERSFATPATPTSSKKGLVRRRTGNASAVPRISQIEGDLLWVRPRPG